MKTTFKKIISHIMRIESELVLARYKPKVIAITGSVGKTSTKDTVYAVLSKISYVRKSEKSYNSEIGLPLTILGCSNAWNSPSGWMMNIIKGKWLIIRSFWSKKYPKWLVLEVGVGKPGDMKKTASWVRTDAVVITAIGHTPPHVEFFESRKHLIEEKSGLIKTLRKDGVLVLNADDEAVLGMKSKTKCRVVTYGFGEGADVRGSGENISYSESGIPEGIVFRADVGGHSLPVVIEGVFGRNHVYAALASLAVSLELKLNMIDAINALKNYEVPPGRMRLLKGMNQTLIIDDTYNSSPFACEASLTTLGEVKSGGRKIAVLGDMLELGKHTEEAHRNVGKIAKNFVDILVVVGPRAKSIKEGAVEAGMQADNRPDGRAGIYEFMNSIEAAEFMQQFIQKGDLILVKGSQGMRMERVVSAILEDQANKAKLLVRQNEEWLAKL